MADPMLIAKNAQTECALLPGLANRHGLITGATGTGKTVTLQKLAESFSQIGVPVFMADIKGDLTGISQAGSIGGKMAGVLQERGIATEGLGLSLETVRDPEKKRLSTIRVALTLPPGFPEKYAGAIQRAVDQCAVKKHLVEPPAFELTVN